MQEIVDTVGTHAFYWASSFVPCFVSLVFVSKTRKFFQYSHKHCMSFTKKITNNPKCNCIEPKEKKDEIRLFHYRQHFAIVILLVMLALAYIPIQILGRIMLHEAKSEPLSMVVVARDMLTTLFMVVSIWIVEHFKDEEGGKFSY